MQLIIPDTYSVYKVLGIDPGLNNTGIAIFTIDCVSNSILNIDAFTLINDKLSDYTGLDEEQYTERTIKLYKLQEAVNHVLAFNNPIAVGCEAPFYNRFRPMAYGALLEVVNNIFASIIKYNPNILFHLLEPLLVKKIVGAGFMKGKISVKESVAKIPELVNVTSQDLNTLDEHSIDAIAVGYSMLKTYRR